MASYKQFDEKLHSENDERACNAVLRYLIETQGLYAVRNDDKYGPDIIVFSGFRKPLCYVEPEVKLVWKSHQLDFPWDTVQVPSRKEKFTKLGLPIDFWILREDLKFALVISDKLLIESPLMEVPNRYNAQGEYFYQVNVDECQLKELEE